MLLIIFFRRIWYVNIDKFLKISTGILGIDDIYMPLNDGIILSPT